MLTRIPNSHEAVLPDASFAVQETFVRPGRKMEPGGIEQVTGAGPQASRDETAYWRATPISPRRIFASSERGQVMDGGVSSTTVTEPTH